MKIIARHGDRCDGVSQKIIIGGATLRTVPGGYILSVSQADKKLTALLPTDDSKTLEADGITTTGAIKLRLERKNQSPQIIEVPEGDLN